MYHLAGALTTIEMGSVNKIIISLKFSNKGSDKNSKSDPQTPVDSADELQEVCELLEIPRTTLCSRGRAPVSWPMESPRVKDTDYTQARVLNSQSDTVLCLAFDVCFPILWFSSFFTGVPEDYWEGGL